MKKNRVLNIPQWTEKGFPLGEEKKILDLYSRAFNGRTIHKESIDWQMHRNPVIKDCAASLWDGDTLVAYNAITPAYAYLNGKKCIVGLSGTTMSNEDYLGVSIQLAKLVSRICSEMAFTYGFPNHDSYQISVKYNGNVHVGDIAFWKSAAVETAKDRNIRFIDRFENGFDSIVERDANSYQYIKSRSLDYLNWRFVENPDVAYKCYVHTHGGNNGFIATSIYEENGIRQLQVVDIISNSKEVFRQLIRFSKGIAFDEACKEVKLWMSSKEYSSLLEEEGFVYGDHPFALTTSYPELSIESSYFTMADSDIF